MFLFNDVKDVLFAPTQPDSDQMENKFDNVYQIVIKFSVIKFDDG